MHLLIPDPSRALKGIISSTFVCDRDAGADADADADTDAAMIVSGKAGIRLRVGGKYSSAILLGMNLNSFPSPCSSSLCLIPC